MPRRRRRIDPNQLTLDLDFGAPTQQRLDLDYSTPPRRNPEAVSAAPETSEIVDWVPITSSRVEMAAYISQDHRLYLSWVKPGRVYAYEGVTPSEWQQFRRSKSPGRFVNRRLSVKTYYPVDLD